ncbi:hypothetical protein [Pseudofrankia asymbiotica]|nr:hypothetical protein [Pseudofrankia asymbiotica]
MARSQPTERPTGADAGVGVGTGTGTGTGTGVSLGVGGRQRLPAARTTPS